MKRQQSLANTVLADPKIKAYLDTRLPEDVKLVLGPYPVLPDGGLSDALTTESWTKVVATVNRKLMLSPLPESSKVPEFLRVPDISVSGPVVGLIKARLHDVVRLLATGHHIASGTTLDGKTVQLPTALWIHPHATVHLGGGDFLILENKRLEVVFRGLMIAKSKSGGLGKYGDADLPLLEEMERLIDSGRAHSITEAADLVKHKAVGASPESCATRLRKKFPLFWSS